VDPFVNRQLEFDRLDALLKRHGPRGALVVVYGRRRVGKSRLLREWAGRHGGLHSQAIEGSSTLQLSALYADLAAGLEPRIEPRTWEDLFALFDAQRHRTVVCLDEFPYLVAADPTLPSRMQKWLDRRGAKPLFLILSGSSTRMMHGAVLAPSAPLFGRAVQTLRVDSMTYGDFCRARHFRPGDPESFVRFSMVGGVPKYWEFCDEGDDAIALADSLFFRDAPYMEGEPGRLLADESLVGIGPMSVLEAIGRGAERPSEIAARMGARQTTMSKVLAQLVDAGMLVRDVPFGESVRNAKRTLYRIVDPAIRFWYRVASPHRTRWAGYARAQRTALLRAHAGTVFEDACRALHIGARRYWESDLEFDAVWKDEGRAGAMHVMECKLAMLTAAERRGTEGELAQKWNRSRLARAYTAPVFEVIDGRALARL